nr:immunoglobulin heavy chain junction region [Macaca mulatta]MOV56821.1 immunoglobulin heavy chain junction region [Macaca mulatta]MOV57462.1 immunoglobulin heavy chain junction region [Macaca mulatta]MOV58787.1 immunoglobulin heavy chain junction region [Macaca mulatta]MOV59807.1 immunoglobulin heavy chain junction region [Macaca mulatta]
CARLMVTATSWNDAFDFW